MRYRMRDFGGKTTFSRELDVAAITGAVPKAEIESVLDEMGAVEERERKLNMVQVIFIFTTLFPSKLGC